MSTPVTPVTSSQTIGPFWHMLADPEHADLTRLGAEGSGQTAEPLGSVTRGGSGQTAEPLGSVTRGGPRLELTGVVYDGDGAPVTDACVEIWQATPAASPAFTGWGRCATDPHGGYRFVTLAPDAAAPYFAVAVFARGLLRALWTRVYFADTGDALLAGLPAARRQTLIAQPAGATWRWDIRLQGDGETVFLDL